MAVRDILKMGDPRLLRLAKPVPQDGFDSDALHLLVSDLLDTMKGANGAGLAAPQIGQFRVPLAIDQRERSISVRRLCLAVTDERDPGGPRWWDEPSLFQPARKVRRFFAIPGATTITAHHRCISGRLHRDILPPGEL